MSLYRKHRPTDLDELIGQSSALAQLSAMEKRGQFPQAMLLSGPSGVGKTTIGRILKSLLECGDMDFAEINCSDHNGIDTIRDIRSRVHLRSISGKTRIWLLDESHLLSSEAQNAFLKLLEDTPKDVYFILATTHPVKLIKTIHSRVTEIKLVPFKVPDLVTLLLDVVKVEKADVDKTTCEDIAEAAEGSARKALVILEQVMYLPAREQATAIERATASKEEAIQLAREIITGRRDWPTIAKILKDVQDQDPEGIRHLMLSYARSVLLGGGKAGQQAFKVIDIFSRNFYDSKNAGLAAACWEAAH
jgi:DNA polymerase III subunit gamma/tau